MKVNDSNEFGSIVLDRLTNFEETIGSILPEIYREFIIEHNGGIPDKRDFTISKSEGESGLHVVFGLHNGPEDARLDSQFNFNKKRLPKEVIPWASDPMGNYLCIGLTGEYRDSVLFWDHEQQTQDPALHDLICINRSFSNFMDMLFIFVDQSESEIDRIVKNSDLDMLEQLVSSGYNIESLNDQNFSMLEIAAIHNKPDIILFLHGKGAKLRSALDLAIRNFEFFPGHIKTVELLKKLGSKKHIN
jgi:hypothetical protein